MAYTKAQQAIKTKRGHIGKWYLKETTDLYTLWVSLYPSEEVAIAHAVWFANITTYGRARSSRSKFESVRDEWIKSRTAGGMFAGTVPVPCYRCRGTGYVANDKKKPVECPDCDGGVFEIKPVYLHRVVIEGLVMTLRSFTKPEVELALDVYEGFDVTGPSQLPMTGLLRILSYYAVAVLGMRWVKGRYRNNTSKWKYKPGYKSQRGVR